jgi:hypothetical protein
MHEHENILKMDQSLRYDQYNFLLTKHVAK